MHTLFALFNHPHEAEAAYRELEALGTGKQRCAVVLHKDRLELKPSSEAPLFETAAASTFAKGTLLGGALGAALGAVLLGPFGLAAAGPLAAALFGGMTGAASGAYVGVIAGASDLEPVLKAMAEEIANGHVLLAVEPATADLAERAEHILVAHHGRIVHRHLLRGLTLQEHEAVFDPHHHP